MEFGKKIRQLRFQAGLTQEQLAEKMSVSPQSVSKWENAAAMPDITSLPLLSEIFGVTIDDLFDLTVDQRFNRIENRLDTEDDLPTDVFTEYEAFLAEQSKGKGKTKKRATELLAYLYWHRMEIFAKKARKFAKDAIQASPGEKGCQWILQKADGHAAWDWNMTNHTAAIDFYRSLSEKHPAERTPLMYLIDQLIADHRADEAEAALSRLEKIKGGKPVLAEVYRAAIALARFDEKKADAIMEDLLNKHPDDADFLFEAAQYDAKKAQYEKAVPLYEKAFEKDERRPRFTDALLAIRDIQTIRGEYEEAAETTERILALLQDEWGIREGDEILKFREEKASLLKRAKEKR